MNKKGFTLIELLAVIVILAIIALITAPIILGVIENARKDAAKDKAWGTISAVRLAYTQDQTKEGNYKLGTPVDFSNKPALVGSVQVKASGELPASGTVTIREDGSIIAQNLKFGNYTCSTVKSETDNTIDPNNMVCVKGDGSGVTPSTLKTVYAYHYDTKHIGDKVTDYKMNYRDLSSSGFFKYDIDSEDIIQNAYVCYKYTFIDEPVCMQGYQDSEGNTYYNQNKALLESLKPTFESNGGSCTTGVYCVAEGVRIWADSNGEVVSKGFEYNVCGDGCMVTTDGSTWCGCW